MATVSPSDALVTIHQAVLAWAKQEIDERQCIARAIDALDDAGLPIITDVEIAANDPQTVLPVYAPAQPDGS